jgi:hypothetical protein
LGGLSQTKTQRDVNTIEVRMNYEIWKYGNDDWKLFLDKEEIKNEIITWEGCRLHCNYFQDGKIDGWDIIFPAKQHNRILQYIEKQQD